MARSKEDKILKAGCYMGVKYTIHSRTPKKKSNLKCTVKYVSPVHGSEVVIHTETLDHAVFQAKYSIAHERAIQQCDKAEELPLHQDQDLHRGLDQENYSDSDLMLSAGAKLGMFAAWVLVVLSFVGLMACTI